MRPGFVAVLLVVVGCSSATSATTSNLGEQALTPTTTAVTTTASQATTPSTLGPAECPSGGGGQTARGFLCPPDLASIEEFADIHTYMPGVYRTRLFAVPFEFTRHEMGSASGEQLQIVQLNVVITADENTDNITVGSDNLVAALDIESLAQEPCVGTAQLGETTLDGRVFQLVDLSDIECEFFRDTSSGPIDFRTGNRVQILSGEVHPGVMLLVMIRTANQDRFDTYLNEVALPLLDSIRFLDQ